MTETQQSICSWADATFGPPVSDSSIAARALVEMAELVTACVNGASAEVFGGEIADVVIVLARLGRSLDVDVLQAATGACAEGCRATFSVEMVSGTVTHLAELLGWISDNYNYAYARYHGRGHLRRAARCLGEIAARIGIDIPSAIDAKMAVNRARRWVLDGNGHGRHVKEQPTSLLDEMLASLAAHPANAPDAEITSEVVQSLSVAFNGRDDAEPRIEWPQTLLRNLATAGALEYSAQLRHDLVCKFGAWEPGCGRSAL